MECLGIGLSIDGEKGNVREMFDSVGENVVLFAIDLE